MSPASATSRLLALLVDALVLLAAGLVGWALLDSQVLAAMTAVEALAVLTLVRAVTGRSPGALATRTAMVRAGTQTAPGLWPALARQALLVALGLTVLGPVVTVALSRDGRDWVDRLVGTGAVDLRERHDSTPQEVLVNVPTSQGVPEPQASPALAWQGPSHPGRPVGSGSLVGEGGLAEPGRLVGSGSLAGLGSPVGEGGLAGLGPGRAGPEQTGPGQVGPGPEPDWESPRTAPVAPSHPGPVASRPDPAARPFLPEPVVPLSPTPGGLPSPVPQPLSPTPPAPPTRPEAAASPEPVPDEEPAPTVGPAPVVGPEPDAGLDAGLAPSAGPVPVAEPAYDRDSLDTDADAGPMPTAGQEPEVPPAAPAPQDPAAQLPAETPPAPAARQPGPVRPPQLAPVAPSLPEPVEQPTPVLQPLPLVSAPSSASPAAPAPGTPDDAPSEPEQAPPASGTPDDAPDLAQTPDDDADVPADHDVAPEPEQALPHDQEHSAPSPQDPPPTREPSPDPAPSPISGSSPAAAPLAAQEPREEPDADQAHRSPAQAPTQAGPIPYLVVDSGERLPVDDTVLVLGRAPSTSDPGQRLVTLSDPTRSLSRTHLRVGCSKHGVWVEDAFSANGTHVRMRDGASYFLPRGERVEVPFGTVLLLGERRLTITTDLPRNQ